MLLLVLILGMDQGIDLTLDLLLGLLLALFMPLLLQPSKPLLLLLSMLPLFHAIKNPGDLCQIETEKASIYRRWRPLTLLLVR